MLQILTGNGSREAEYAPFHPGSAAGVGSPVSEHTPVTGCAFARRRARVRARSIMLLTGQWALRLTGGRHSHRLRRPGRMMGVIGETGTVPNVSAAVATSTPNGSYASVIGETGTAPNVSRLDRPQHNSHLLENGTYCLLHEC